MNIFPSGKYISILKYINIVVKELCMFVRLLAGAIIGAAFGGLMGYFGKCTAGACPLTANPWRGAFFGLVIGLMLASTITSGSISLGKEKNSMVINVGSPEAFIKAKDSNSILLVDFYAPWCYPCKLLSPVLEKVAEKFQGKAAFYKIDVDQFAQIANEYGIEGTPTVLIFKDGKVVEKLVGLRHEADYNHAIDNLLQGAAVK